MAYFLGAIAGKIVGLPGLLGFISGVFASSYSLAVLFGFIIGVVDTIILDQITYFGATPISWISAVLVGSIAAILGHTIRSKWKS